MKISTLFQSNTYNKTNRNYLINYKSKQNHNSSCKQNSLYLLSNYNKSYIKFGSGFSTDANNINKTKLSELKIPNMHIVGNNVRGESLSSKKNRKFLIPIKKCGIESVIDLRDKDTSQYYEEMCQKSELKYYHIPIDSNSIDDRTIIDLLPTLCSLFDKEHLYIACAQGLHRTDIAFALNYVFNPKKLPQPPVMYGHFRPFGFKFDDIATRLNSIERKITFKDIKAIGWQSEQEFQKEFLRRKKELKTFNENYCVGSKK